jgi:TolB-like protein/Tfp pilus assembly protein PilF
MSSLFKELKRRHVIRVGLAYLVVGWLIIQFVDVVGPTLDLPDWFLKVVLLLLAIGLPISLLMAWALNLIPEGIMTAGQFDTDEKLQTSTGRKLDFILIGALVLALGYFIWDKFVAEPQLGEVAPTRIGASIAVLPFADMSAAGDQEYFADGISEELLNLLAKTPNLRVAARTSSFQFKGQRQDIQEIARQLGVETVLEGSIRKSGNRLRITAQLIDAKEGFHIWSDVYDRELDDIFVVQDEIAGAIVTALRNTLGLGTTFAPAKTTAPTLNMAAHNAYLLGRHSFEKRTRESLALALESFRRAIELDPDFAPAWAGIGSTYNFLSERAYGTMPHEQAIERARGALDRALELDPNLAEAHAALGNWYGNRGDAPNAIQHFERATESNPNSAVAWHWYSLALDSIVRIDEAFEAIGKAAALDPLSMIINYNLAQALIDRGRLDEAEAVAGKMMLIEPTSHLGPQALANIHMASGRIPEAIMAYRRALALEGSSVVFDLSVALADIGLGEAAFETLKGTAFEGLGELYRGELDTAVAFTRANWPSSPGDGFGTGFRAYIELLAGDLEASISYFERADELLGPAMTVGFLIGRAEAYRRSGDDEGAATALAVAKARFQAITAMGIKNDAVDPLTTSGGAGILAFERRFDEAFEFLRQLLERGRLGASLQFSPFFAELREQPEYARFAADYLVWQLAQQAHLKSLETAANVAE